MVVRHDVSGCEFIECPRLEACDVAEERFRFKLMRALVKQVGVFQLWVTTADKVVKQGLSVRIVQNNQLFRTVWCKDIRLTECSTCTGT
jgi:hypothetical protein